MTGAAGALLSPSAARNRDPILSVLRRVLPESGTVLEIASGTGEHAVHFAAALPGLRWQPTDVDPDALESIAAHRSLAGLPNLLAPLELDVSRSPWPLSRADIVVSINMVHIAPWAATLGLIAGAGGVLPPGGLLVLYGPFFEDGVAPAPSNLAFDQSLRERNPDWGIRRVSEVVALAVQANLHLRDRIPMPANNLVLVLVSDASVE